MIKPWLIIDGNFMAHRAWHAVGNDLINDEPLLLVHNFLRDCLLLQEEFHTDLMVFTFDRGYGKRRELYPKYKYSRETKHKEETDDEKEARGHFYLQLNRLREQYLLQLGYRNVFSQPGYEGDDIIASVTKYSLGDEETGIIVSNDGDLWQLITPNVVCYDPRKKVMTDQVGFVRQWGIDPVQWADVKAFAGCRTDDVPGLYGIGDRKACKWIRGEIRPGTVAYKKLSLQGIQVYNRNIRLVRLPFEGTERFELRQDEVTAERWRELAEKLNMPAIRDLIPGMPKGVKKRSGGFGF